MKKIQLGHHQKNRVYKHPLMWALVDDADFEDLNKHRWSVAKDGNVFYARRQSNMDNKLATLFMHTQITKTQQGMQVDHIDGNGLNNQRDNLRVCTSADNQKNRGKNSNNTSGFKGVSLHKGDNKWQARIRVNRKLILIGMFPTPELASEAYIEACRKYHGEFARKL